MLGNVVDHRTDPSWPEVDAVFEPSAHDNAVRPDGRHYFDYNETTGAPGYFHVVDQGDTTVRAAVVRAETEWAFPVTVYLYDRGRRPLG